MGKIKSFVTGTIFGLMLGSLTVGAYATLQAYDMTNDHTLFINNKQMEMGEYKLLNYNSRSYVPLRFVSEQLGQEVSWDEETKSIYIGEQPVKPEPPKPEVRKTKVLMFHDIVENGGQVKNEYQVSKQYIENVLKQISKDGLTTGFVDENTDIIITLDDGYKSNYTILFPLLKKYNIKATIFACSDHMYWGEKGSNHFSWKQAQEMVESGLVDIQAHTTGHYKLTTLTKEQIQKDCDEIKQEFKSNGLPVPNKFAYPYGAYNKDVQEVINNNFEYVATSNVSIYDTESIKEIPRYNVPNNTNINKLLKF
jgi:peptidoglycan/xylan/chitin deacetylase (PgdA/CDA1 family)